ncbi:MAG: hypothetical protein ACOXZ0_05395 [Eubacteriales bacterium]
MGYPIGVECGRLGWAEICLRERDIQRAVRVWGGSKRLREWDIRWVAGIRGGLKALRFGMIKTEVWAA